MKINDETTTREALVFLKSYVDLMFTNGDEKSDFEKALRKAITALDHEIDYGCIIDWIFSDQNDKFFKNVSGIDFEEVENALGIKLFYWQKYYIARGEFRCYGKTTAQILRDLLIDVNKEPLDVLATPMWYRDQVFQMKEKLDKSGIKTRRVRRYKERGERNAD